MWNTRLTWLHAAALAGCAAWLRGACPVAAGSHMETGTSDLPGKRRAAAAAAAAAADSNIAEGGSYPVLPMPNPAIACN